VGWHILGPGRGEGVEGIGPGFPRFCVPRGGKLILLRLLDLFREGPRQSSLAMASGPGFLSVFVLGPGLDSAGFFSFLVPGGALLPDRPFGGHFISPGDGWTRWWGNQSVSGAGPGAQICFS